MAEGSAYEKQLNEAARLTAEASGITDYNLVYQSRSGRPQDPWLEPDICDHLETVAERGVSHVIVHPIGFISDHMEVLFDLDTDPRTHPGTSRRHRRKARLRRVRAQPRCLSGGLLQTRSAGSAQAGGGTAGRGIASLAPLPAKVRFEIVNLRFEIDSLQPSRKTSALAMSRKI